MTTHEADDYLNDRDLYMDTQDRWDDPDTNDGIEFARGDE